MKLKRSERNCIAQQSQEDPALASKVKQRLFQSDIVKRAINPLENSGEDSHSCSCATPTPSAMNHCSGSLLLIRVVKVYEVPHHAFKAGKLFRSLRNIAVRPSFEVDQSHLFRLLSCIDIILIPIIDGKFADNERGAHLLSAEKAHRDMPAL